jgi:hypothetical protein
MINGVHLTLLIGPGVPIPAPPPLVEALESVQITSGTDRAGFQLAFSTGPTSLIQNVLLPAGFFDPIVTRVIVMVTVRGTPQVLIDGVVTRHEVAPSNEPGKSTLTVTGEDLTVLMDLVEMPFMRYPAQPVPVRILAILAKYAAFGIAPIVIPPLIPGTVNPLEELPTQRGTDLAYIRELASNAGYVFYLEPGPAPGMSLAYFGPDVRIPIPQPALAINLDAFTNVESLSFSLDGLAKKIVVLSVLDPVTKKIPIPLPVPNISVLRPPLGARPTPPAKVEFSHEHAALDISEAIGRALGISFAASDAITATGSLDVTRYGWPLRSRMLVGVRGAGLAYDGLYYVNSVSHDIRRGQYKQGFSLSRDGLVSPTPIVPALPMGLVG